MAKWGVRRQISFLLATSFLVANGSSGAAAAPKKQPEAADGSDANAQAIELNTINVQGGDTGYSATHTSTATKTDTPLINIPQSITVVTKEFIKDQSFQGLTDVTRYVPGVAVHQGEGNRDELVIRGVDLSANFFVNGFRDDVQYFRDLYNTQSIEVLKGPSALTFGRGAGGGLVNRTLKEADGQRIYETTLQTGSYGGRRVALDAGQAVNANVAARLNMFYEGSDTFRDYGKLERYGVNPTFAWKPTDDTKIKLSYEYYHDERTADRGNPSQATLAGSPSSTRFNPATPFAPNGNLSAFFGSPTLNVANVTVNTAMAVIDHDFGNGLTVKNSTLNADYKKFYQNVYPGGGTQLGAVNPADTSFNYAAYQHWTNRENLFNQTDFIWKGSTGPIFHTLAFGTEFGRQNGIDLRNTGGFPVAPAPAGTTACGGTIVGGLSNTLCGNPFSPTYFGPVTFIHNAFQTDTNSVYRLNIESAYVRDTLEITRWLQLIGGARLDSFDLDATDQNTGIARSRVDTKVSPQAAIIMKPIDNVSIYGAYSVSYLPASGDQFSSLTAATLILDPQKFVNTEFGVKWNINPRTIFSAAIYQLDRTGQPIPDPSNPGFSLPNGAARVRGFETSVAGYVTDQWQTVFGYAYTDARIRKDLTASTVALPILAGNRVQLVPENQFSWWNRYQFTPTWAAGLGVIYFSDFFATSDDTVRLPGFVRVDAALYWKFNETWKAQLNVENIFNKGYWASADGNNNISPGQPRTFRVSAIARF